jgi:hypothetical protein
VDLVKVTVAMIIVFILVFLLLFYFAMENSPFGFLFGNTSTTAAHVDEPPPPTELDHFKIPMKIVERVRITATQEMELSIRVITYYL